MFAYRYLSAALALAFVGLAQAESFDGSQPLVCTADRGHDCVPTQDSCSPLKTEPGKPKVFQVDFAKKEVHSPFRTDLLKVQHTTINREQLIMQGSDFLFAWSAMIKKASGAFTISIADREGAYVVFGQCKLATPATDSQK
jgi:hypothetical protein